MAQIILLSGGLDSMISYRLFYPRATPVFVDTSSIYTTHDHTCALSIAGVDLVTLKAPALAERFDGVVPHRNAVLLSFVANRMGAHQIIVSAPRGELIWDQQPAFHRAMEKVLRGVEILNPLRSLTKTQAVALLLQQYGHTWAQHHVSRTRSCYSDTGHQCGQCPACVKRWVSLQNNGLSEFYHGDVRAYARQLASRGTVRDLLRYGLRPALEARRALQQ
jgi:7-cyano-7-deazaguanine synthase in queuosine biosynthesis